MNNFNTLTSVIRLFLLLLLYTITAGCGGGGGSSTGSISPPVSTVITGTVAKGVFNSGVVECYFVNGATKGPLYRSAAINTSGGYAIELGSNSGIVILEAYGSYIDESTNITRTIDKSRGDKPLRSVLYLAAPGGTFNVAITPLTELAVLNAYSRSTVSPPALTNENVTAANVLVSDLFTFDIQKTQPVQPLSSALFLATDAQKRYTLVNTGISTLAPTPSQVHSLLASYSADISVPPYYRIEGPKITALLDAIKYFLDSNIYDNTGYSYAQALLIPLFPQIGFYTTNLTIMPVQNSPTADTLANVVQFALLLDNYLTVENTDGKPHDNVVTILSDNSTTYWDSQLVDDDAAGKKALNISIINTLTGLKPNSNLATVRLRTNPSFNPSPASIQVKHQYQNNIEKLDIPFAAKDLNNTVSVDWSISFSL